jgi:CHC2 zinc finger/Toprim domain
VFSEDELERARSVSVPGLAEDNHVQLKKQGAELHGPCPVCHGRDRFIVWPKRNRWHCRGCARGGDAIKFQTHVNGLSFIDAVRALIGQDAGTPNRRQPTAEENAARMAREAERRRAEAEEQKRNESSAARTVAQLQPVAGTPGEAFLRDVRKIDVSHWAIRRALENVDTLGWCERVYFKQDGHELHGQWLGAIVGILTDPVTAEPTGGITRTYIHRNVKIGKAKSLGGVGRLGIIRLSPDDEVGSGLHICEGIESGLSNMLMGFCPLWAAGSTSQLKDFPVLAGIECLTIIADHDIADEAGKQASQQAARFARQRWAAAGRETVMKIPKTPGEDANDILKRRAQA